MWLYEIPPIIQETLRAEPQSKFIHFMPLFEDDIDLDTGRTSTKPSLEANPKPIKPNKVEELLGDLKLRLLKRSKGVRGPRGPNCRTRGTTAEQRAERKRKVKREWYAKNIIDQRAKGKARWQAFIKRQKEGML